MKEEKKTVGRPSLNKNVERSAEKGTKQGEMRKTYLVDIDQANKIEAIAYWDRVPIKDVVSQAFEDRIVKYEKKNGKIKPKK